MLFRSLYLIFGHKNVHLYRGLDDENLYHWWVVDRTKKIIDLTSEQYTLLGRTPPYENGTKAGLLGFEYKKRVHRLLTRVKEDIDG